MAAAVGTQIVDSVYCGNTFCESDPLVCKPGCVCCVYTNARTGTITNSRCRPPESCRPTSLRHVLCPDGTEIDKLTNTCVVI